KQISMKTLSLIFVGSLLLSWSAFSQTPTVSPVTSPTPSPSVIPTISPAATSSPESDLAGRIHHRIDQRLKQKGLSINFGDDDDGPGPKGHSGTGDVPEAVIPLVAIIFMTIFGA